MNISRSKVKFMQDGELYTFLQKDEDSGLRFYYDGGYINLVTKNEVLENMPDVTYLNNHRIFYYLHGQCIQLAVYEDITGGAYTLTFNNEPTLENNGVVTTYNSFTTGLKLDVEKEIAVIEYNNRNTDIECNDYIEPKDDLTTLPLVVTEYTMKTIDMTVAGNTICDKTENGTLLKTSAQYTIMTLDYTTNTQDGYTFVETESTENGSILTSSGEITYS